MTEIEINYDNETQYYDALILSKGIATQGKSLDELMKNINQGISLFKNDKVYLGKFSISFDEKNYVNI